MFLKKLELFGFKSFAERTAFDFKDGITCVVGPNGCGKSNVVDAFKWILGSQSAKGLRGSEMKDVIFNGTQTRKPLGLAEVSVVFDNQERWFDIDYNEVSITRRLYRSGESEYLINKQKCRLKDIKDLLMDTGFGTTSYSILEQGKIDVLLQASTLDRRVIFEEAAGISKFRARKAESLRALIRVEDNLSRLQDIIDEVEKRIRRVKAQASKARRYREYSERLQDLRVRMALEDWVQSTEGRADLSFQLYWLDQKMARFEDLLGRLSKGLDQQIAERERFREMLRELREKLAQEQSAKERCEETLRQCRRRLEELAEEEARKKQDVEDTREALARLEASIGDERLELETLEEEIATRATAVEAAETALAERQEEHQKLRREHAERSESIVGLLQERSKVANRDVQLSTELLSLEARKARLETAQSSVQGAIDATREKETELAKGLAAVQEERAVCEAQREALGAELAEMQSSCETVELELAATTESLHRKSSRLDVLHTFEERLDGVASGVAEILRRAEEDPESLPGWRDSFGLVAGNLHIEREYARAVEAVLGERAQSLIVGSQEGALQLLEHARGEEVGGVSVVSIDRVDVIPPEFFPRHGGVLGPLRDQVRVEPHLEELADRLFANVVLVEDFATALALARNGLRPFRLVTLAGEVLEPWGAVSVPGPTETGIISRRSEMEDLADDLEGLESERAEQESRLDALRQGREAKRREIEAETQVLDAIRARQVNLESESRQHEREVERLTREVEVGAVELDEIDTDVAARIAEQEAFKEQLSELDARRESLEEGVNTLATDIENASRRAQDANEGVSQARVVHKEAESRSESLRQLIGRQETNLLERQKHLEDLETEIARTLERRASTTEELGDAERSREEISSREETLAEELAVHDKKDRSLQEIEQAFRTEIDAVRQRADEQRREREQLQLKDQEERHRRNTVLERIDEEYGLDLVHLLERASEGQGAGDAAGPELAQESSAADESQAASSAAGEGPATVDAISPTGAQPILDLRLLDRLTPRVQGDVLGVVRALERREVEAASEPDTLTDEQRYLAPIPDWDREVAQREAKELQSKIRKLGNVNLEALEELEELEERFRFQLEQKRDLVESERKLRSIIGDLNAKSRELFQKTFDEVQEHFKELFRKCFGGGRAELVLEEGVDILEAGIDIVARPPGKKLTSLSLMSGGERTMTTIALLLAIFRARPSPFCVLDEVDAPLDEANVRRFVVLVKEFVKSSQFIIITHNKATMGAASSLYGVTMQERGISKRVQVELESYDPESMEVAAAGAE